MSIPEHQQGFLLPLMTALLIMFSGIWLSYQQPPSAEQTLIAQAAQVQGELLFWHRGVLHFQRQMGYWPIGLRTVAQHFNIPAASSSISGVIASDGFKLALANVSLAVTKLIVSPLKAHFQSDNGSDYYLFLTTATAEGENSRLINRDDNAIVQIHTGFDFANFGLHAENLTAGSGALTELKTGHIVTANVASGDWFSDELMTDDLLLGPYSLLGQQQKLAQLYDALWYCMYVSEYCFNAPKDM